MAFSRQSRDFSHVIAEYYAGNTTAFGDLFSHWFPYFVSHAKLEGFAADEAEDLAAEALMKVAMTRHGNGRFDPSRGVAFSTWIYRIAANTRLDLHRRRQRRPRLVAPGNDPDDGSPRDLDCFPGNADDPSKGIAHGEIGRALEDCLRGVASPNRQAFVLYYLEEGTLEDIASASDVSIATASRRVREARTLLRDCLESKGFTREAVL
ncbi:MAG: sigma-70 family RNA polymerase sigma factor [Paludibaculum sp.]